MPTFSSFKAYERELAKFQAEVERSEKQRITEEQAAEMQRIATERFSSVLGGDPKFSGWVPLLETQVRSARRPGASLLTPTRTGAGPITVAFNGRNRGNATGFSGPAINRRTGMTARNKRGNLIRRRTARRQWNGYTDPKLSPDDIRIPAEKRAGEIAEQHLRRTTQKHFDVD